VTKRLFVVVAVLGLSSVFVSGEARRMLQPPKVH
jgi:hypothetical protein